MFKISRVTKLLVFLFGILLITGCGSTDSGSNTISTTDNTDSAAVRQEVESSDFFSLDITDDKSSDGAVYETKGANDALSYAPGDGFYLSFAWGRGNIELLQRNFNITITGDTASVTVTDNISGILYVDTTEDGQRNPWEKPFEDTIVRNAELIRTSSGWRLSKITPVDISLTNSEDQTVHIVLLRASVNRDGNWEKVWETDSSSNYFVVPDGLPGFTQGDEVLVEAEITNTNEAGYEPASYVFLHRPGGILGRTRDLMFDDGTHGDLVAGDGIYSRTYTILHDPGHYTAAVDVIDAATFLDESAPYNSSAWGMPYIVSESRSTP